MEVTGKRRFQLFSLPFGKSLPAQLMKVLPLIPTTEETKKVRRCLCFTEQVRLSPDSPVLAFSYSRNPPARGEQEASS